LSSGKRRKNLGDEPTEKEEWKSGPGRRGERQRHTGARKCSDQKYAQEKISTQRKGKSTVRPNSPWRGRGRDFFVVFFLLQGNHASVEKERLP